MRKSLSLSLSFVLDRDIRNRVWDWELLKPSPLPSSYDHRHSRIYFFTGTYVHTFISQNRKIKTKFYISVMPFFTMIFHFTNLKKKKKILFKFLKNLVYIWFYLDRKDGFYFLVIKIDDVTVSHTSPLVDFKDMIRFFVSTIWRKILLAYFWVLLPL